MGYFKETLKGMGWMGGLRASTRIFTFIKIAVLARLLLPNEFGLFGIATLVLAFLEIITETGVNIFLIQEREDVVKYLDTSFIVSIIRGILMSLTLILLAPFVAGFFKSPDSYSLIVLISIVPFIRGFINPAVIKFQKNLMFSKEFFFRLSLFAFDAIVAVFFAVITRSAASFVWGMIAGASLEVIASHLLIRPRPRIRFEREKLERVIRRGRWVTIAGVFNYLFEQGDDIAVGRFLSASSLGIYQAAYKIAILPITEVSDVVIKVTFPIYVKISGEKERLRRAFLKSLIGVSLLTIPLGVALFVFTDIFVFIILGVNWLSAIPVIKILSFFGVVRALTTATYPLFLSLNKQEYITIITFIGIVGLAISIIPMVLAYGVLGAAYSATIGALVAIPPAAYFSYKLLK